MSDEQIKITKAPKKKPVNGKRKGSGFELTIGKKLSEVLAPLNFKRTQQSGAITGGKNARNNHLFSNAALSIFVGDIFPTNEADVEAELGWKFKFSLECKFYKTADNLDHLFANTKIKGWFEQACTDAAKIGKEPLLIFKFNHTEIFCAVNSATIDRLPATLSRSLQLSFPDGRAITVFLLKEAIEDLAWWKVYTKCQSKDQTLPSSS
jgi:hypothetical protein